MHRSLMSIVLNHDLLIILPLFNIFEDVWLNTFGAHSKSPSNTVKLTVFEVKIFMEIYIYKKNGFGGVRSSKCLFKLYMPLFINLIHPIHIN